MELAHLSDEGLVTVRFDGMCTGCPSRPVTIIATIKRCLGNLDFVTGVVAEGVSVSDAAMNRVQKYFLPYNS